MGDGGERADPTIGDGGERADPTMGDGGERADPTIGDGGGGGPGPGPGPPPPREGSTGRRLQDKVACDPTKDCGGSCPACKLIISFPANVSRTYAHTHSQHAQTHAQRLTQTVPFNFINLKVSALYCGFVCQVV